MDTDREPQTTRQGRTRVERISDCDLVVTRRFDASVPLVFAAWTRPDLLMKWWAPKSSGASFLSCEADVRTGGRYRFVFAHAASDQPMAFHGRYVEVVPDARLVWTNEEGDGPGAVTTVTFEAQEGGTLVVMRDRHPSKEALDAAIASGSTSFYGESFDQLDGMLADPGQAG